MRFHRLFALALPLGLIVMLLAGCGTGGGNYGGTGGTSTSTSTSTSTGTGSASGPATVATATATVSGASKTILTNSQGMTLYYFDPDTATTIACTGGCANIWPALLTSGTPQANGSLSGTLGTLQDSQGLQVTYNGHPLYTYSGDTKPGDTTGDGIQGKWHVATPSIAVLTSSQSGGSSSTPTSPPRY